MIRHCVLLTLIDGVDDATLSRLESTLADLAQLPMINAYRFGRDLGLAEGNVDFAIIADFATEADYQAYAQDPTHLAVLAEHIKPLVAERKALQFEY